MRSEDRVRGDRRRLPAVVSIVVGGMLASVVAAVSIAPHAAAQDTATVMLTEADTWQLTTWTAPRTGPTTIDATWTGSSDVRLDVRLTNRAWIAADTTTNQPKRLTFDATQGTTYRIATWTTNNTPATVQLTITPPDNTNPPPPDDRPNVLIIQTDDQRIDEMVSMPRTRQWFGAEGRTYPNGFVSTPSCCPSRVSLLTGRYVHNHGTIQQSGPRADRSTMLQRALDDAGYLTGHSGKYPHYVRLDEPVPDNWDRWFHLPGGYVNSWVNLDGQRFNIGSTYSTDLVFDTAIDFARDFEQRDDGRPWLLHVNTTAPHRAGRDPAIPAPRHADAPVAPFPTTPRTFESDTSDKPSFVFCCDIQPAAMQTEWAARQRALFAVDEGVDRLLVELEATGELDNTIVFYLSDNSWLLGDHTLHEKFLPYDNSVEVPFFIRWPDGGVGAGSIDARFAGNVDIAATIYAATGVPAPTVVDGRDLIGGTPRTMRLTEYWRDAGNVPGILDWTSITTATYQYTEYRNADGVVVAREYYDRLADPYQLVNLLGDGDPGNDPATAPLAALVADARICAGAACP